MLDVITHGMAELFVKGLSDCWTIVGPKLGIKFWMESVGTCT